MLGNKVVTDVIVSQIRVLLTAFFANNGLVKSKKPEFLQYSFNILVCFFERIGLLTSTIKVESMTFIPSKILTVL